MSDRRVEITRRCEDERVTISKGGLEIRHAGKPISSTDAGTGSAYLVIDCSWSMEGIELAEAKKGAGEFVREALSKGYSVGLIRFASSASHICEPQRTVEPLQRHLKAMKAGGSTNMAAGTRLALDHLRHKASPRVAVVATDGVPDSEEDALAAAQEAKRSGIDIITIGTENADRGFLSKIASRTDLAITVSRGQLGQGIASIARMLPRGK